VTVYVNLFVRRQIIALLPRRQITALLLCPCGGGVMIHDIGSRRKPDRSIVAAVIFGPCAAVYLASVIALALYIADLAKRVSFFRPRADPP